MTTKRFCSIFRLGILVWSFYAFHTFYAPELDEPGHQTKFTMGDPKIDSPQGQRCFDLMEFTVQGKDQTLNYEEIT